METSTKGINMKKILLIMSMVFLVGCGRDKTTVISNDSRVSDLEARTLINEQIMSSYQTLTDMEIASLKAKDDQLQSQIDGLSSSVAGLQAALDLEVQARISGDNASSEALQAAISAQQSINAQLDS